MPCNPWLAIDATTSPTLLARAIRRAWEQFVRRGQVDAVRPPVLDSWRRSVHAGVQPSGRELPPVLDAHETSARWEGHPLAQETQLVRDCLAGTGNDSQHLSVISDADGVLLWIEGDAETRGSAAASMNFVEGALWSETSAGTNAIGTALAVDHAVQIFASEHFKEVAHAWTCCAAPIHDPDSGELLGTVDLIGRLQAVQPHSLAVAAAIARAVESALRCRLHERHDRMRSQYHGRLAACSGRRALVTPTGTIVADHPIGWLGATRIAPPPGGGEFMLPSGAHAVAEPLDHEEAFIVRAADGKRIARLPPVMKANLLGRDRAYLELDGHAAELPRRLSEILALLSAHPAGMTSERLAVEIHGDGAHPGTARVEVYRLRKLLGPCIESEPYRLTIDMECDLTQVQSSLHRGAIREAARCYPGPLLPRSDAPGIVHDREALERWLRHAVMTAEDDEALWAWLRTASGWDDLAAWKRLLGHLDYHDPRRSLAASRVTALRSAYGLTSDRESCRRPGRQVA
jgi:GAF domain-containing protein